MTVVYRLFDSAGRLLYVGVTDHLGSRLQVHSRRAWWPQVADRTTETFDSRIEAFAAEARAIEFEHPLHNVRVPAIPKAGLGAFIHTERVARGLNAERFAVKAGVTARTVRRLEAGILPTFRVLGRIADALELPLASLVEKAAS